jgi:hypothetical protein
MASPHALFLYEGDRPKPYPGGSNTQFKLGAGMALLQSSPGESNAAPNVVFLPRTLKTGNTTFDDHTQAGSNAVLIDQKGQIVYYTSQINKSYYDFVVKHTYYELATFKDQKNPIPQATAFPPRSLEIKSSWRIASKEGKDYIPIQEQENYYTVMDFLCQDNACKSKVKVTMALIGFHVVGMVEGHPEMVWATFEHDKNVPDCKNTPSSGDYSLYPASKNCGKAPFWESCNQIPTPGTMTPSDVCRAYPYGEIQPSDQPQRENTANVLSINDSYKKLLAKLFPKGSVWSHYTYVGAVWTTGETDSAGLIKLDNASIRGSRKAANTSMESFTQEKNCLHCHTYQPAQVRKGCFDNRGINLYVSHLLGLLCDRK